LRELVAQTLQQIGNVLKTQLRIFTMKKSLLMIAITAALFPLAFSMEANATKNPRKAIEESIILGPGTGSNGGVWLNGVALNGWQLNGPVLQGTTMQGTKRQGMELQSLKVEGGQLVAVTRVAGE
jgi:hypothetical protein